MKVNDPRVVAEVRAVFDRYEAALIAHDVETLIELFHDAPETLRYGIDDVQHGHEAITAFRRAEAQATPPRRLVDTVVTTYGNDLAVVNTEFVPDGSDAVGRQSQTWLRTPDGWRVVSAHVSWMGSRAP